MKILISGISGFVGSNLVESLKRDDREFISIGRSSESTINWDNLDSASPPQADAWIHLAGKAHDVKNKSLAQEYTDVNLGLTQKLFEAFLKDEKAKIFIHFSTVKAAASSLNKVLSEEDELVVEDPYGKSKRQAEKYLLSQGLPPNKSLVILRPCMIHGPGNKGNLNLLFKLVQKGIPYPLAAYNNERSFLSIDNLCFTIDQILEREKFPSGVYNIADDAPLSTNDLVKIIAEVLGQSPRLANIPKALIQLFASIGDVLRLPLNNHRLGKLTETYVVSNEKLKRALNLEKFPIEAEEGLKKTIRSFLK